MVRNALKKHRVKQFEKRLQIGTNWFDRDLVFPNEWGEPLEPTRVNRALKKSLHTVGIERHIRVHDLRHTAASLALRKGIAGKVVQEMLGHESITITEIYTHPEKEYLREVIIQFHPRAYVLLAVNR